MRKIMIPVITMLIMLVSVLLTGVPLSRGIILYILMFSFGTFCGIPGEENQSKMVKIATIAIGFLFCGLIITAVILL